MSPLQNSKIDFDKSPRKLVMYEGKTPTPAQRIDESIKENIYRALWQDDMLRVTDYDEIDVYVKDGLVCLSGHILSTTSQSRIDNAIQNISGVLAVKNELVLDDNLTLEVAASLARLEQTYGYKFFTGVSHGVVSLNGVVANENIKLLAEKCAADNSNVRGVINNIHVLGTGLDLQESLFLQPVIGEIIYFADGLHGSVKQVIINPNNRRVIAMTVKGRFAGQSEDLKLLNDNETLSLEQLVTVSMNEVRYLTKTSGFLYMRSDEKNRYMDFAPGTFIAPDKDWVPPYPYHAEDILIPVEYQNTDIQAKDESDRFPFGALTEDASIREQFFASDSFGL